MKSVLRAIGITAAELACFMPVLLPVSVLIAHQHAAVTIAAAAVYYWIGRLAGLLRMKIYVQWLFSIALSFLGASLLVDPSTAWALYIVIGAVQTIRGIRASQLAWIYSFPIHMQFVCLIFYLAYPLFAGSNVLLEDYDRLVWFAALVSVSVLLFRMNREQLDRANHSQASRTKVAAGVLTANRLATAAALLVLVLIANIGAIRRWLLTLWIKFADWLRGLLIREPNEIERTPDDLSSPITDLIGEPPPERSIWWERIEQILMTLLGFAALVALAAGIAFAIVKVLIPALRRWMNRMNKFSGVPDYVDETEVIAAPDWVGRLRGMMGRFPLRRPHEPADNRERVRRMYRQMVAEAVRDGYEHKPSYTPAEAGRELNRLSWAKAPVDRLVALYNRVRYGELDVSDEELQSLKQQGRH